MIKMNNVVVIGAGVAGCTIARLCAEKGYHVFVLEKKHVIGGQAHDKLIDKFIVQQYGIHIVYTDSDDVFDFLSRFSTLIDVKMDAAGLLDNRLIRLPVNFYTFDDYFDASTSSMIKKELLMHFNLNSKVKFKELYNIECKEYVKDAIVHLLDRLFVNYSKKQWKEDFKGVEVINRVPMIIGYTTYYYPAKYHVVPREGYTQMFTNMISHDNITLINNINYRDVVDVNNMKIFSVDVDKIFNTSKIDEFYDNKFGTLKYRSLNFEFEKTRYRQKYIAYHYPENNKYIRSYDVNTLYQRKGETIICREIPTEHTKDNYPLYTLTTKEQEDVAQKYKDYSKKDKNIYHIGRCAEYHYYKMDDLIVNCMKLIENKVK